MESEQIDQDLRLRSLAELRQYERQADTEAAVPPAADRAVREMFGLLHEMTDPSVLIARIEDLAFGSPSIAHAMLPTVQTSVLLRRCGSPEQKARLLPELTQLNGRNPVSMLLLEENGLGPREWRTVARQDGDRWRVSGRKTAVNMNGSHLHLLAAKTRDATLVAFLTNGSMPGQNIRNTPASPLLALKASRLGSVRLDDVVLDEADRLNGADDEPLAMARAIGYGRLLLGAVSLGAGSASLAYAQEWAMKRQAFGKTLASFEGVAFDIADLDTRLNASRYMLRQVAHDIENVNDPAKIDEMAARALARVTTTCALAAADGVQLMGVHGIIHEHPQELFYRTAAALSTLDLDPLRSSFRLS